MVRSRCGLLAKSAARRVQVSALVSLSFVGMFQGENLLAATYTWTNAATNSSLTLGTNWSGAAVPVTVAGDVLDFSTLNITAERTVTMDQDFTIGSILFGDITTASNGWTFNPGTTTPGILYLDAAGGAPTITVNNARTATINAPITILNAGNLTKTGDGTAILNGTVTGWLPAMVNNVTAGTLTFGTGSGVLFDAATISKTAGTGTVQFNAVSSLTLPTSYAVAPSGGGITIAPSGTMEGTAGFTKTGAGTFTISPTNLNIAGTYTTSAGTLTIGAIATVADSTTFTSNSTLNLNGATALGATVTFGGTSTTTINGVLSGSNGLIKSGAGTLILANAANTFTGVTQVNAGFLQLTTGASNTATYLTTTARASSSISVASGATLDLYRGHAATIQTVTWTLPTINLANGSNLRFRAQTGSNAHVVNVTGINLSDTGALPNTGSVTINNNGGAYAQSMTINGPITGNATINYSVTTAPGSAADVRTLALASTATTFSGNWVVDFTPASADDWAALQSNAVGALGTGSVTLARRSRLLLNVANGLNSIAGVTIQQATSGIFTNGFAWTNPNAVVTMTNGTLTLGSGVASSAVSIGNLTAAAGTITTAGTGTANALTVNQTTDGTVAALITETTGTPLTFTKNGTAMLTLTNTNLYTGVTTIGGGTLQLGNGGTSGSIASTSSIVNNANLVVNRSNEFEIATVISGTGNFTQAGTGTTTLSGANQYTGNTNVTGGTLLVTGTLPVESYSPAKIVLSAPDSTLTGNPTLALRIGAGVNYTMGSATGLGSTAAGIDLVTAGSLNTSAAILAGTASSQTDVSMQWRLRTTSEADGANINAVLSDVVNLSGTGSDVFLLEMSYNDAALAALNLSETSIALSGELRLGWFNGTSWVTAATGNSDGSATFAGPISSATFLASLGADPLASKLGFYGVDPATNKVWAVLNHNSEFAVIPEPSSLALGGMAVLGFAGFQLRRRRRNS